MTPREIVLRAIERTDPPRLPLHYCNRDLDKSDTVTLGWAPAAGWQPAAPGMTEWGYAWQRLDDTMGQPHVRPLEDWAKIETYSAPDPLAPGRLDHLPQQIAAAGDRFLRFSVGISGFNQATFLRGYENLLMDLAEAPERAERVLDIIFGFENALIRQVVGMDFDALAFADDWGTQRGLMIAPATWRRVFRPRYERQFAMARAAGKKVWFHTCGNVWEIIEDLIGIGVDVLELLQPDIFGVERLAARFGGRVTFCCAVDHQRRAISGTREEIRDYARLLHDRLGRYHGGFIGYIEDYASLGMDEQHYRWVCEAFHALNDEHAG